MRKILFLLLLIAGWALIFTPILSGDSSIPGFITSRAHPSKKPLPQPWQGSPKIELNRPAAVESSGDIPAGLPMTGSICGATYAIRNGDTLGEVARACGVALADLLRANPQIKNPNRVFAGQQITLPDSLAGRGGGDPLGVSARPNQVGGFHPGSAFTIDATGLPSQTPVRVGLGLSISGYKVLSEARTDAEGRLSLSLNLPANAKPGETGFIMVTTRGVPSVQRVSERFTIGD